MSGHLGLFSAGALLGMARCYDTVALSFLLSAFTHLGLPPPVAVILVEAALAPRRLVTGQIISDTIEPANGLLAGCPAAVTSARIPLQYMPHPS